MASEGDSPADPIVVERKFSASPARVFRAWTEPEEIKKWFGSNPGSLELAQIDLRPGGRWRFVEMSDADGSVGFEGRYITIEPEELLVFSWSRFMKGTGHKQEKTSESRVEVLFRAAPEGTHLTITHSGLDDGDLRVDFAAGWRRALPNLSLVV